MENIFHSDTSSGEVPDPFPMLQLEAEVEVEEPSDAEEEGKTLPQLPVEELLLEGIDDIVVLLLAMDLNADAELPQPGWQRQGAGACSTAAHH